MSDRLGFMTVAALLAMSSAGQAAETLVGGPLYAGDPAVISALFVNCRIFNFSNRSVTIGLHRIYDNAGTNVAKTGDSCTSPLGPMKTCAFSGNITGNFAFSCVAIYSGAEAQLSGAIEITDDMNTVLQTSPMHNHP
jgi:hypothetical protein